MSTTMRAQLLETALVLLDGYRSQNPKGTIAACAPNCMHRIMPSSTKAPPRTNDEMVAFHVSVFSLVKNFKFTLVEDPPMIDEAKRTVLLELVTTADGPEGAGSYQNEYWFKLKMTEDGTQVEETVGYLDSKYMAEWTEKLGEWAQGRWERNEADESEMH